MIKPKKTYGQHFLINEEIAEKTSKLLSKKTKNLIEVGAGEGFLTKYIYTKKHNLILFDIDKRVIPILEKKFQNIKIYNKDFLKINLYTIFDNNISLIGNFPYNISNQIIFKVFDNSEIINEVVGMFQKEVAERITSKEGNKKYGITSVITQAFYNTEFCFSVSSKNFNPEPKVESAIIKLKKKRQEEIKDVDKKKLKFLVKNAFRYRRKMLKNNLKNIDFKIQYSDDILKKRPEQISVDEYIEMSNNLVWKQ